jgi:hypothetical protein
MKVHILHIRHILLLLLPHLARRTFRLHRLPIRLRLLELHDTQILDLSHPPRGDPTELLLLVQALEVRSHGERGEEEEGPAGDVDVEAGAVVGSLAGEVDLRADDLRTTIELSYKSRGGKAYVANACKDEADGGRDDPLCVPCSVHVSPAVEQPISYPSNIEEVATYLSTKGFNTPNVVVT